jgi:hypothetical protein
MNSNGTSLMPAAMPVIAPFRRRRSGWHKSQTTSAISTSSIWPRNSARCTGSVQNTSPVSSKVAPARAAGCQPSSRNAIHTVAVSANVLTRAAATSTAWNGSTDTTANSSAANGV